MTTVAPPMARKESVIEAERVILGATLLFPDNYQKIGHLKPSDFSQPSHCDIFTAISELFNSNKEIDSIAVCDFLEFRGRLKHVGGYEYIDSLSSGLPRTPNFNYYTEIILKHALVARQYDLAFQLRQNEITQEEFQQKFSELLEGFGRSKDAPAFMPIGHYIGLEYQELEARSQKGRTGLMTGFADLDNLLGGIEEGALVIVAARPAMGKTSFCLNLAARVAKKFHTRVGILSLEMRGQGLAMRFLATEARVDISNLKSGKINIQEWGRLAEASAILSDLPIFIAEQVEDVTVPVVRREVERLQKEHGIDVFIVDYLQLMSGTKRGQSEVAEITEITRSLKQMALTLNIRVFALSQLSRNVESRTDRRPRLSDLRGSGSIEQDADLVIFLYRESYYQQEESEDPTEFQTTDLIVGKHRNGPTGSVPLGFLNCQTRFENYGGHSV